MRNSVRSLKSNFTFFDIRYFKILHLFWIISLSIKSFNWFCKFKLGLFTLQLRSFINGSLSMIKLYNSLSYGTVFANNRSGLVALYNGLWACVGFVSSLSLISGLIQLPGLWLSLFYLLRLYGLRLLLFAPFSFALLCFHFLNYLLYSFLRCGTNVGYVVGFSYC